MATKDSKVSAEESTKPVRPVKAADVARRVGQSGTLADFVVARGASPLRSLHVFYWIAAWGMFQEVNGREPTSAEEIAPAIGVNLRTLYRWQKAFREVFPEYATPALLWALVGDQVQGDNPDVMALQLGAAVI
jgi:hypothetical protein